MLAVAVSPDGKWLCSAGVDQNIRVWDTSNWRLVRALNNHLDTVHALAFRPEPKSGHVCLASTSEDGTVRIWYPDIGRLVRIIRHKVPVYTVAWNQDGSRLYCGAKDGIVRVLDEDFRALKSGKVTDGWLTTLVFHQKDELIAGDSLGSCRRVDLSDF